MYGSSRPALAIATLLALIAAATFAFAENDTEKAEPPGANTTPPIHRPARDSSSRRRPFVKFY